MSKVLIEFTNKDIIKLTNGLHYSISYTTTSPKEDDTGVAYLRKHAEFDVTINY